VCNLWWIIAIEVWLCVVSYFDIKYRFLPVWVIVVSFMFSIIRLICLKDFDLLSMAISIIPGVFFIIISVVTQKVGIADGFIIASLGIGLGIEECVYVVMLSLIVCALVSSILLLLKKASRNTELPFIPFITIGLGVMFCVF